MTSLRLFYLRACAAAAAPDEWTRDMIQNGALNDYGFLELQRHPWTMTDEQFESLVAAERTRIWLEFFDRLGERYGLSSLEFAYQAWFYRREIAHYFEEIYRERLLMKTWFV